MFAIEIQRYWKYCHCQYKYESYQNHRYRMSEIYLIISAEKIEKIGNSKYSKLSNVLYNYYENKLGPKRIRS